MSRWLNQVSRWCPPPLRNLVLRFRAFESPAFFTGGSLSLRSLSVLCPASLFMKCYHRFGPQLPGDETQPPFLFFSLLQVLHEFGKPDSRFWWREGVQRGGVTSGAQGFRPLLAPHFLSGVANKILPLSCWECPTHLRP